MNNYDKSHEVEWNEEKINNFWDYFVMNNGLLEFSFARETGKDIIKRVKKYIKKDGNNLDYGCGAGYLMDYLFTEGIACWGLDSSQKSLSVIEEKFKDNKLFKGGILTDGLPNKNIEDNTFDFLFSLETIEHILPEKLKSTLGEMRRILKKGGYIFISTPSNENLDKYKVICPDCAAIFHRVQHLNFFSKEKLSKIMQKVGFNTIKCESTLLKNSENLCGNLINKTKRIFRFLEEQLFNKKKFTPHLIYLGKK
ncbi:class I SAM-dependent methyltransferase [Patescibacteria group bacterium]|nr:class I SAM-dependent methyltransferase [Patescibacteria group bacterium]MBU2416673.1 class I SAM-dependent methyltransferase [Patescibacteria group bacterium]MBU2460718.1 class I SAM-dependent methyltransferase [Patescibacteria group bacterium]